MASEAQILIKNTAPRYLKQAQDSCLRGRFWLAYLKKEGRIKYGAGSHTVTWNVRCREPEMTTHSSGIGVVYKQNDAYEQLSLPIASLIGTDALDLKIQIINKDPYAIVDLYGTKLEELLRTASNALSRQLFISNAGDTNRLIGFGSVMVPDAAVAATDMVAVPSSTATYGGKNIALASLGGTWTTDMAAADRPSSVAATDWPYGSGSTNYDWLTPKMLNAKSPKWTKNSGSVTWADNCEHMIRRSSTFMVNLNGDLSKPTVHALNAQWFDEVRDSYTMRERLQLSDYARGLGFQGVLNYDGALIMHDYDCPANKGYAFNASEVELFSSYDQLFFTLGPNFDMTDLASQMLVGFFGNLKFHPRHLVEYGYYGP
jgi:hypothetical protein